MQGRACGAECLRRVTFFHASGGPISFSSGGEFRASGRGSLLAAAAHRSFPSMPPAAPFIPAAKEMGERTPPKTNGFGNSFVPILTQWKKVPQGIGHGPPLAAADMAGREDWRSYRLGNYQIAHLPPSAASAGAAQRAAQYFILVEHGITPRYEGAAAGMGVQAIRRGSFCGVVVIRRKEIQKPSVFGGVFASFCRRGQKDVAPEREIFLWRESRKWAVGDAGPYGV